jgi:hypothetical protein
MVVALEPYTTQRTKPELGAQASVLPALVAADPGATVIEDTSAMG